MLKEWSKLWQLRAVVQVLIARELKVRYRGTVLGFIWSFFNPLIFATVYVIVFSFVLRIDIDNYAAFLLCGLLPWNCFGASVSDSSRAVLDNGSLVKKAALSAEIFPLVSICTNLVHFLLSLPVLLGLLFVMGVTLSAAVLFLPVLVLIQLLLTVGIALPCSSFSVRFRDLLQIVPNLLLVWFFLTPVAYPDNMVPSSMQGLLWMNPMFYLINAYQDILFRAHMPQLLQILGLLMFAAILAVTAHQLFVWRRDDLAEEL